MSILTRTFAAVGRLVFEIKYIKTVALQVDAHASLNCDKTEFVVCWGMNGNVRD